jgi:methionine synthase I (cobalamin-dependent)
VAQFAEAGLATPLWVKPNAGVPRVVEGEVRYPEDPESFAARVSAFAASGARVLGGCCGSTPEHVAALARALGRVPAI